jgi:hypothetical protein
MDYKEVDCKDGRKIVFCNFEELICEACGVGSIEEAERFKKGDEYIIHCPFCKAQGHTKHKLYITEDLDVGHCFVCCRAFINTGKEGDLSVFYKTPDFMSKFAGYQKFELTHLQDPTWSLDKFNNGEFVDDDPVARKYLKNRNPYLEKLADSLGFKYWNENVIIPFYHLGELFYYQIRFTGKSRIRYFLPPIKNKPVYKIEREDPDCRKRILICEGPFDAIAALIQAPEYTPVAVLGSSISDYQIGMIQDYAGYIEEVRVWMDETRISVPIARKITNALGYCPVSIIKSTGPDPEEVMMDRIKRGLSVNGWIKSKYKNKNDIKNLG